METYGFHFRYRLSGAPPTIRDILAKDTATYTAGDLVEYDGGECTIAATDDDMLIGAVVETVSAVDSTTYVKCIVDDDAVYAVTDANARTAGAKLDLAGTTGAMTVAADSNHDLVVVANSSATEPTLVRIINGAHFSNQLKS